MTPKEILLSAISLKKPERNAAMLLSGGLWAFKQAGLTLEEVIGNPQLAAEVIVKNADIIKSDAIWLGSGYYQLLIRAIGAEVKFRKNGVPDIIKSPLKSVADIDKIDLDLIGSDDAMGFLWDTGKLVTQALGEKYLIGAGLFGPFTVAGQIYGTENVMRAIYKDPPAAHAVLDLAVEVCFRYIEPFIKNGIGIVSLAEPTSSGDMISRKHYIEFAKPYTEKFIKRIHKLGLPVLLHICGNITDRLDQMVDAGCDAISVDWKVNLDDAARAVKGKAAFAGNYDPVKIMQFASPDEVERLVRENVKKFGPDGNYIAMPGCDIPHQTPIENIHALLETAKDIAI